jgi:hypothetical protein
MWQPNHDSTYSKGQLSSVGTASNGHMRLFCGAESPPLIETPFEVGDDKMDLFPQFDSVSSEW